MEEEAKIKILWSPYAMFRASLEVNVSTFLNITKIRKFYLDYNLSSLIM